MPSAETLLFALLGGVLPALVWLWFWLREDRLHPEPKRLIALAFLSGMVIIPFVIIIQRTFSNIAEGVISSPILALDDLWSIFAEFIRKYLVVLWAATEEIAKFFVAFAVLLWRREVDEPIDMIIYMITVALGFAALENTLFLIHPIAESDISTSVITGNLRFIGATLLHVLSSAMIGIALALAFRKRALVRFIYPFVGLILAIVLHSLFNSLIIGDDGKNILFVFMSVWIGVIVLLVIFEKIKRIKYKTSRFN
jgi:protease PrsW